MFSRVRQRVAQLVLLSLCAVVLVGFTPVVTPRTPPSPTGLCDSGTTTC